MAAFLFVVILALLGYIFYQKQKIKNIGFDDGVEAPSRLFHGKPQAPEVLCPKMVEYKVRGRSTQTGRIRTESRIKVLPEDAKEEFEGFSEIKEVEVVEQYGPSINTLKYADNLGIKVPDGSTQQDVSIMISKVTNDQPWRNWIEVSYQLAKYAANHGAILSRYCDDAGALYRVHYSLKDPERIYLFIFSVHHHLIGLAEYDMETTPYKNMYERFVEQYQKDVKFLQSMSHFEGYDLSLYKDFDGNKKRTTAYQTAVEFLKENNAI